MKTYRLKNIYFEFIKNSDLDGKISVETAAKILADAGFIELLPDREKPEKPLVFYRWKKTQKETREQFSRRVLAALKNGGHIK